MKNIVLRQKQFLIETRAGFDHRIFPRKLVEKIPRPLFEPRRKQSSLLSPYSLRETRAGFEPANDGFANRSVKPLRHRVLCL